VAGGTLTAALRHRDFRFLIGAFTVSDVGTWAYQVALAVWVYDATGSLSWVAAITLVRFVPALLFTPYAGVLADRFERRRILILTDMIFAVLMVAMGTVMFVDGPAVVVLVLAGAASTLTSLYVPASAALTPQLVPERDLASANALRNTVTNVTVVAGPGLGALLTLAGPPHVVVWINAGTFVASFLLLMLIRTKGGGVDVSEGGTAGVLRQMTAGARTILADRGVLVLVLYSVLATGMFGADTVFFVAASEELLGTGADGYGYLLAGLGVGGLLAAPLVTRAEARPRLAPIIIGGMAAYCLPTLVLLVWPEPGVAFAVQCVRGAGTLVVDVLALTAMQRAIAPEVMGRVFAVFDSMCLMAIVAASAATSAVLEVGGAEAGVWLTGAATFVVSMLGIPWLAAVDRRAAARREELAPRVALLQGCDLFASVPDGGLTELAASSEEVAVRIDAVLVREGDPADALYVVMAGTLGVVGANLEVPDLGPGDYFGEIGLIERVPRTATVTAKTAAVVLRVPGEEFLDVLVAAQPSAAILDGASRRLRRTHPTTEPTRAGLTTKETA